MNDYKRGGFGGKRSGGGFGGKKDFGRPSFGGGRPQAQMHQATCAQCNKECEVPFRPNGQRPVYCRECFGGSSQSAPTREFTRDRDFQKPAFRAPAPVSAASDPRIDSIQQHLVKMQSKLDQILLEISIAKAQPRVAAQEVVKAPIAKKVVAKKAKPAKKK